jgi:hypothetical protein
MEPLLSDDEPPAGKIVPEQNVQPMSPSVKSLINEVNESSDTTDIEQLKQNQTKVSEELFYFIHIF